MQPAKPPTAQAPRPLLSLDEALLRLAAAGRAHTLQGRENVATMDALGRVLAADLRSTLDVPPADNSAMDGYALRSADVIAAGVCLPLSQRIPAGVVGQALLPGTVARIFTGAQVPLGADAVVMQEQCEALPDAAAGATPDAAAGATPDAAAGEAPGAAAAGVLGAVRVNAVPRAGQWIRRRGEDVRAGAVVLAAGTRLSPQALGLAATVGAARLDVCARLRVALFSTGDELVMPGEPLPPGGIYNSNRFMLRGLLQAAGCEVLDLGIVPDTLAATQDALQRAAVASDLIVTSGGVSVGEEDHLRPAVAALGGIENWQIALKPGKPLALGFVKRAAGAQASHGSVGQGPGDVPARGHTSADDAALFIGLPGNPVSSFVTFLLCVTPVLRAMQGMAAALPLSLPLVSGFAWPKPDRRREFLRARLGADGRLQLFDNQSSGVLTSTVWADGLVDNPAGQAIAVGDTVRFLPLSALVGS
jgi:molybdopterin molybdotransferase